MSVDRPNVDSYIYGYLYCWFIAVASAAAVLCFVPKDSVRWKPVSIFFWAELGNDTLTNLLKTRNWRTLVEFVYTQHNIHIIYLHLLLVLLLFLLVILAFVVVVVESMFYGFYFVLLILFLVIIVAVVVNRFRLRAQLCLTPVLWLSSETSVIVFCWCCHVPAGCPHGRCCNISFYLSSRNKKQEHQ